MQPLGSKRQKHWPESNQKVLRQELDALPELQNRNEMRDRSGVK